MPPSTTSSDPVMKEESSLGRNRAALAHSRECLVVRAPHPTTAQARLGKLLSRARRTASAILGGRNLAGMSGMMLTTLKRDRPLKWSQLALVPRCATLRPFAWLIETDDSADRAGREAGTDWR